MSQTSLSQELLKEKIRLVGIHRWTLYLATLSLWISGAAWLGFKQPWNPTSELADSPWAPLLMKIHGASAMLFLMLTGSLLFHVLRGWAAKRNRISGSLLGGLILFLAATGWGLYYVGSEEVRNWVSFSHWALGLAMALALPLHIFFGRRSRQRRTIRFKA